jgi:anthranilate synthase component 1
MANLEDHGPDYSVFSKVYDEGKPQVVYRQLVADLETPISAFLKVGVNEKFSCLLESVEGGAIRGRYTFIGIKPDIIWKCHDDTPQINRNSLFNDSTGSDFESCETGALLSLKSLFAESRIDLPEGMPPSAAGMIGYMGYDMVRLMEEIPQSSAEATAKGLGLPDSMFIRPTIMIVFDAVTDQLCIITPVRPKVGVTARIAYERAELAIEDIESKLSAPHNAAHQYLDPTEELEQPISNTGKDTFFEMVKKAQDYIVAGDIFQVVLSQRFEQPFVLAPFSLYRALRRTNPSPFLYYLEFGHFSVIGSSPEILVRLRDGEITMRPIAGTRRRGKDTSEDLELAADLLSDPKELSEHLMLLDLGRNDVGRVSKVGSIEITQKMLIEYYSHVMHIVSEVRGEIDPQYDALKALAAGFPAGTVSGAPKVRAMEIINELEVAKRGIYAGGVGYFSADGSMDTCIILRTAILKDKVMYVQSGAGIVADSTPEGEYAECEAKAQALFSAAKEARKFALTPADQ